MEENAWIHLRTTSVIAQIKEPNLDKHLKTILNIGYGIFFQRCLLILIPNNLLKTVSLTTFYEMTQKEISTINEITFSEEILFILASPYPF